MTVHPISVSVAHLSDHELTATIRSLAQRERRATAELIVSLAEFDARSLYLGQGCSSLFTYCTNVLHLSEHAAYGRIEAARAARRFPLILDLLFEGAVTLTTVGLLAPHLTEENHSYVLATARHKSKREVEQLVSAFRPQPPLPASIRKLPAARIVEALLEAVLQESNDNVSDSFPSVERSAAEATTGPGGMATGAPPHRGPSDRAWREHPLGTSGPEVNAAGVESLGRANEDFPTGEDRRDESTSSGTANEGTGRVADPADGGSAGATMTPAPSSRMASQLAATANGFGAWGGPAANPLEIAAAALRSRPIAHRAIVAPLSAESYRIQFTASREMYEKLRRAQDLLRHQIPDGDPAAIFDRALSLLVAAAEKSKLGSTSRPKSSRRSVMKPEKASGARPSSRPRRIPAEVRREVWKRDQGRCAFVGEGGRCTEQGFLEFHHVVPYAAGGEATVHNIQLRCRAHNAYEALAFFGVQDLSRESEQRSGEMQEAGPRAASADQVTNAAGLSELGPDRVERLRADKIGPPDPQPAGGRAPEQGDPPARNHVVSPGPDGDRPTHDRLEPLGADLVRQPGSEGQICELGRDRVDPPSPDKAGPPG
jgi:hypothetical protein